MLLAVVVVVVVVEAHKGIHGSGTPSPWFPRVLEPGRLEADFLTGLGGENPQDSRGLRGKEPLDSRESRRAKTPWMPYGWVVTKGE